MGNNLSKPTNPNLSPHRTKITQYLRLARLRLKSYLRPPQTSWRARLCHAFLRSKLARYFGVYLEQPAKTGSPGDIQLPQALSLIPRREMALDRHQERSVCLALQTVAAARSGPGMNLMIPPRREVGFIILADGVLSVIPSHGRSLLVVVATRPEWQEALLTVLASRRCISIRIPLAELNRILDALVEYSREQSLIENDAPSMVVARQQFTSLNAREIIINLMTSKSQISSGVIFSEYNDRGGGGSSSSSSSSSNNSEQRLITFADEAELVPAASKPQFPSANLTTQPSSGKDTDASSLDQDIGHNLASSSSPQRMEPDQTPITPADKSLPSSTQKQRRVSRSYPQTLEKATAEDRMLIRMGDANRAWPDIISSWESLTGRKTSRATMQRRYRRLKLELALFDQEDYRLLIESEKAVSLRWHTQKWREVAKEMQSRSGSGKYYNALLVRKRFQEVVEQRRRVMAGQGQGQGEAVKVKGDEGE